MTLTTSQFNATQPNSIEQGTSLTTTLYRCHQWFLLSLGVLCLTACSDDGKRFSAKGVDLRQHSYLQLDMVQLSDGKTVEICAAFQRSAKRGDWIGEYIQTWWTLTPQQQLSVNGNVLKANFNRGPGEHFFAPRHYCATLATAPQYHLEWRDDVLGHRATDDVLALPDLQPGLVRDPDQSIRIQWQVEPQSDEQLFLDITSAEPALPVANNGEYSEWPQHGAGRIYGSSGRLKLHSQTQAIGVRFMHTRLDSRALLGFRGVGNRLHQYRETDAKLFLPPRL
ncbi:hypothetical protein HPT27_14545 [Permianibacter sp. IMCC34836]|uniref:hypothetical protein n=1 Tax=Permianibacter fluminis TaxID=2738515 RepID=UPI0015579393|nr:hypothetical protein [Permianibacter fluminis]NQD38244.1 hypothetical protein [Permianibacter fluminis]